MEKTACAALVIALLSIGFLYGCAQNAPSNNPGSGNFTDVSNMPKNSTVAPLGNVAAKKGDLVSVNYIGKLQNGSLFDTSIQSEAQSGGIYNAQRAYEPLEFTVGAGQMIAGFDSAVVGMREGEEKTVTLPPEQAYGNANKALVLSVPLKNIPNPEEVKVGTKLYASNGASGKVIAVNSENATIDFNSELAGKTLIFTIRMVKIGQ